MLEKITKKMNGSLILGLLGGIIVIATALYQWNEKNKEEEKARISKEQADSAIKTIIELQEKLISSQEKSNEELREANKKLFESQEKLAYMQSEVVNEITGGGNKPCLKVIVSPLQHFPQKNYYIVYFQLLNKEKYPLHSVKGTLFDCYGAFMLQYGIKHYSDRTYRIPSDEAKEEFLVYNPIKKFDVGTITKGSDYNIYVATMTMDFGGFYLLNIQCNNGSINYLLTLKQKNKDSNVEILEFQVNDKDIGTNNYSKYLEYIQN